MPCMRPMNNCLFRMGTGGTPQGTLRCSRNTPTKNDTLKLNWKWHSDALEKRSVCPLVVQNLCCASCVCTGGRGRWSSRSKNLLEGPWSKNTSSGGTIWGSGMKLRRRGITSTQDQKTRTVSTRSFSECLSGRIKHAPNCGYHFVSSSPPFSLKGVGGFFRYRKNPPFCGKSYNFYRISCMNPLFSPTGNWRQKVTRNGGPQSSACLILSELRAFRKGVSEKAFCVEVPWGVPFLLWRQEGTYLGTQGTYHLKLLLWNSFSEHPNREVQTAN